MEKVSGYTIYSKDAKKKIKRNLLDELYPALPEKKYDIIIMLIHLGIMEVNCNLIKVVNVGMKLIHQKKYL